MARVLRAVVSRGVPRRRFLCRGARKPPQSLRSVEGRWRALPSPQAVGTMSGPSRVSYRVESQVFLLSGRAGLDCSQGGEVRHGAETSGLVRLAMYSKNDSQ